MGRYGRAEGNPVAISTVPRTEAGPAVGVRADRRPTQPRSWGWVDLGLAGLVALPLVLWTVAILRARHGWLAGGLPDDAYYYLEIGQRIAGGDGSTFDGVHSTNGYHPLWQGLVALLGIAFSGDHLVKAVLLLAVALVAAAVVLLIRAVSARFGQRAALVGAAVALHASAFTLLVNGMETALVLFAVAVLIHLIDRQREGRPPSPAIIGIACAGLVLSRIDLVIVVPLVPLLLGYWGRWRDVLRFGVAFAVLTVPLFIVNLVTFGIPLSVSGSLKLHWMSERATSSGGWLSSGYRTIVSNALGDYVRDGASVAGTPSASLAPSGSNIASWLGFVVLAAGAGVLVRRFWTRDRSAPLPKPRGLGIAASLLGLKALVDLTVLPLWATSWYAGPLFVLGTATLVAAAWQAAAKVMRAPTIGAVGAVIGLGLFALPSGLPSTGVARADPRYWQGGIDQAAAWLRQNPVPGRIGAFDAGLLGFELHPVAVVNLDGLVNDPEHAQAIMDGASTLDLLRRNRVGFLVGRLADDSDAVPSCATEVWRSTELIGYQDPSSPPSFVPMRIVDVRCATQG
jgi:uncharacterized membrane protein